nr:hypothetical protein [Tanacetum cinerariifolium]
METTIEQQVALDEALVPSTKRDDILFLTIKVISRHQNTQQYGTLLHIELTNEDIRNTKAYKKYYVCATREATPKPKASARRKMRGSDTSITPTTAITTPTTTIAALSGSSTDEGTSSKPGVPDVPSDDSEDEISWNSLNDEDVDASNKDRNNDEGDKKDESDNGKEEDDDDDDKDGAERDDDDDDEEDIAKIDELEDTKSGGGDDEETKSDEESDEKEIREEEEESFDLIPRTSEDSEDDGNGEEDQGLRVSEEQRLIEEEEADELYRDIDINQGRGLQLSQDIEDSHVTLTPVNLDGQQESSSVSSHFVSSMLNPTSDAAIITTMSHAPIPPTPIQSEVLQNLLTFDSVFRFDKRLKSLEANFSEYRQTNPFADAVSNILEMELKKILIEKMEGNKEDVRMMMIRKDPPLDQTRGLKDEEMVGSLNQLHPEWFPQPKKPPTLDRDWNKTLPAAQGSTQLWISDLAKQANSRSSFNELLDTSLEFSNFIMNRLRVDTLTPKLLAGPTYELMRGSCNSLTELEYHMEEVYKATMDQLDWVNPEGQQYPHNLLQPLPLIPDNRDGSLGTDLVGSLRTDLDGSSGTDLDGSSGTDLDGSYGTDLVGSLRTDLDGYLATDLDDSLRTDLVWPL